MKTLLYLAVAIGIPAVLFADDQTPAAIESGQAGAPVTAVQGQPVKMVPPDRFTMSAGSVAAVRGTLAERLSNDVKLLDGTILTTGGTVRRKDGSEMHLADGQSIGMDGKLGPVPAASRTEGNASETVPAAKPQ